MTFPVSTLIQWLAEVGIEVSVTGATDTPVSHLTFDSRTVKKGALFAALPGSRVDGHDYIEKACEAEASAILVQRMPDNVTGVCVIQVNDSARALAAIAARFFGPLPACLQAVTGTNGKTSVAHFVRLLHGEEKAVSIGTLGMMPGGLFDMPYLTSPDQIAVAQGLAAAAQQGREFAIIEASSHGLDQGRLDGLTFDAAAFTNLSRDHLDYHATMEDYWLAKRRLFTDRLISGGSVVIDERTPQAAELDGLGLNLFRLGALDSKTAALAYSAQPRPSGLGFTFRLNQQNYSLDLPLFGTFQGENIAVALALAHLSGLSDLAERLAAIPAKALGVPGRMMPVVSHPSPPHGRVLVDYAHTPDALATVLQAARPHCRGKLIVAFGAGGDRDPGKRILMGKAAADFADLVIVTDDNPRTEDPAPIRATIRQAAPNALDIGNRRKAIETGLSAMEPEDLFIIAGKGHETGQIVGDTTLPFDDAEEAQQVAQQLWGR
ncbi:MAG: UDP-N-acetylmuramoyl-L-alanyl-D-glutamate--2,6-diaminopimelate ligase [Alphaproteobacteria bacterium]